MRIYGTQEIHIGMPNFYAPTLSIPGPLEGNVRVMDLGDDFKARFCNLEGIKEAWSLIDGNFFIIILSYYPRTSRLSGAKKLLLSAVYRGHSH